MVGEEVHAMANPEHLQILKQQGVAAWNKWRRENRRIRPDLSRADLVGTDLREADLGRVLNAGVDLTGAGLTRANLARTNLARANLTGANLSQVRLYGTVFGNTNLTDVEGLETCKHAGPSILDLGTLAQSGSLPLAFLRGCGLPDSLIEYLQSLLNEPRRYDSLFISYASRDQPFAERLYADLQNKGVRCWYAPEDMKTGDDVRSRIDTSIHLHDRLLLILSEHSLPSRRKRRSTGLSCFRFGWMMWSCM
jgi:TIR domain-containing protein/pentapeptide repeat protein